MNEIKRNWDQRKSTSLFPSHKFTLQHIPVLFWVNLIIIMLKLKCSPCLNESRLPCYSHAAFVHVHTAETLAHPSSACKTNTLWQKPPLDSSTIHRISLMLFSLSFIVLRVYLTCFISSSGSVWARKQEQTSLSLSFVKKKSVSSHPLFFFSPPNKNCECLEIQTSVSFSFSIE